MYLEFLKAYKQWIDDGAPEEHPIFVRWSGLCFNMQQYAECKIDDDDEVQDALSTLRYRLDMLFNDASFPFNRGDSAHYDTEGVQLEECHLNPDRIAFVKAEIKRLENGL